MLDSSRMSKRRPISAVRAALLFPILLIAACNPGSHRSTAGESRAAAAQPAAPRPSFQGQDTSCKVFVQEFYDWYVHQYRIWEKSTTREPPRTT